MRVHWGYSEGSVGGTVRVLLGYIEGSVGVQ